MSELMFGPDIDLGFVDKRRSPTQAATSPLGTIANYASNSAIDARLTAISATSYSAARLRQMNINDKIYALRVHDDSAGIN